MLQSFIISALLTMPVPVSALEKIPTSPVFVERMLSIAEGKCPTEYRVAEAAYAKADHPGYSGLWGVADPRTDTWYWNAFATISLALKPQPDEIWRAAAWSVTGSEIVGIPLRIAVLAEEVRDADASADVAAQAEEIAQLVPLLEAVLALEACLLPSDEEIAMISAQSDISLNTAVANLECRNWRAFSRSVVEAHGEGDVREFADRFEGILQDKVGRCEGDKE